MLAFKKERPIFAAHCCVIFRNVCFSSSFILAAGSRRYHSLPSSYGYDSYIINSISNPQWNNLQGLQWQTQINCFPDIPFPRSQAAGSLPAREEGSSKPAEKWMSGVESGERKKKEYMEEGERDGNKAKREGEKDKREGGRAEVSLNWESITEARVERPLSVSRKHTEMCSSAEAL